MRTSRHPSGARSARRIAEAMVDELEKDPDAAALELAWVIKLLQVAREEAKKAKAPPVVASRLGLLGVILPRRLRRGSP